MMRDDKSVATATMATTKMRQIREEARGCENKKNEKNMAKEEKGVCTER